MAVYTAWCPVCSKTQEYTRTIEKRNETPSCCGQRMERKLDAPKGYVDTPAAKQ